MSACFIVRAQVLDPMVEDAFDRWYGEEHLPEAVEAFGARRAWRGWSDSDQSVHYAFYEFDSAEAARAIQGSPALARLVAEFDRAWGDKVRRSRDIVEAVQTLAR
jgi:hypothetical protein